MPQRHQPPVNDDRGSVSCALTSLSPGRYPGTFAATRSVGATARVSPADLASRSVHNLRTLPPSDVLRKLVVRIRNGIGGSWRLTPGRRRANHFQPEDPAVGGSYRNAARLHGRVGIIEGIYPGNPGVLGKVECLLNEIEESRNSHRVAFHPPSGKASR